jgi:hypothetical protein
MNDTPEVVERQVMRMFARRSANERLRMASSMFDSARKLVEAGLRNDHPTLGPSQLRARMFVRLYGDCFGRAELEKIVAHIPNMQLENDW